MPNIITHGLFAKAVYDQLNQPLLKKTITEYPREFIIGSNGPDFLFFYRLFQKKHENIRAIGNRLHSSNTNDFYGLALDIIEKCEDKTLKDAMTSYIAGHLCHWALDSHTHPYIFYKTGAYSGPSASMHHRFESMLDAMMLKKIKNESIKTFRFYLLAKQSEYSVKAISALYVPIVKQIFEIEISEKEIKDALNDWYKIQTWLYDPKGIKTKLLRQYEKKVNWPWLFSGNVVPFEIDNTYDILNEQKKEWKMPTDDTKTSKESFMEIYHRAKHDVIEILNCLDDKEKVVSLLHNASYDTGESELKEMKYFDLIYGEQHENL